jgi:type I restriction enzyme S subunit
MKKYDSYKNSEIEWIGEVPSHWDVDKLNRIFQINTGFTPSTGNNEFYENGKHDWITIRDLEGKYVSESKTKLTDIAVKGKTIIPKGSLLYSFKLSVGQMAFTTKEIYTNEAIFSVFPSEKLNLNYYYYLLDRILIHNSNENIYGAKILNQELIKASKLLVPSEEEQTQIANYLDHKTTQIDTLISKKKQFITLLQEERIAVINQAVTKGLDPKVKMKDSGIEWLGEIPEHWEVKKLKLLANIQGRIGFKGYTVGDLVSEGEGALTLGAKHIDKFNQLNLSNPEFISWDKYYESPEIMVMIGDLILTQRGTLGKVVLITEDIGKATINPSMVILSKLKANDFFLYYFFNSDYFKSWIDLTNTATAVPMISQGQLGNLKLVLPNIDEQNKIVTSIQKSTKKIDDIIVKANQEIELLKEYKTGLISEVVTGKVDVRAIIIL